ncbi:TonB-dependent siderophore receptor [Simiduia curdlanivorans]|uniref:TonB-dependent siderophore receptor n=1 Tax=Simiduia curdlanivorans TaxID=1492769 RepID=A0ABV8V2L4_9GAMM|nr:TonB-dependent siderophore receptor [Simiduia curdlanivorans]MDN3637520.1 TonB-dependent siderophore receptor [Simiduia curdlanivorans]
MKKPLSILLSKALLAATPLASPVVLAQAAEAQFSEEISITGIREDRKSRGATGLDLSAFETPQSLTIIDVETIQDFGLVDINSLLKMATGVNVDSTETDRTYYNARGFDITSMHVDGIGMPFGTLLVGDRDTAIYDKVEVIRGSNGLVTGLGNPSGTINYVRKRPTNDLDASVRLNLGEWNNARAEVDVSTPLTDSGSWAARFVGVYQDKESWLDHYGNDRQVAYVVVDGQLSDNLTLTTGYTHQSNNSDGVLWGALPMLYKDGTQADYDVSTTTTMDWTYWNTQTDEAFVELGWQVSDNWRLVTTATYTDYTENSEIFYIYSNTGLDPDTGLGLVSYPGKYDDERQNLILDASLVGDFSAWGQQHSLQLGVSSARSDSESYAHPAPASDFISMPAFPGWQGNELARPNWGAAYQSANEDIDLNRVYGSVRLALTDKLNLLLGVNAVDYTNDGISYGVPTSSTEDGTSPYLGFTWELVDGLNAYASYSDIYQPQYVLGEDLQSLGSAEGKSYEAGLKKAFGNNTLVTLALFRTEQSNLQEFKEYGDGDGVDDDFYDDDFDFAIYRGIDVESEGVELEIVGDLSDTVSIQAGITHLSMEDPDGNEARTFIPRNTAKLFLTWDPSQLPDLKLGMSARWQDNTYYGPEGARISQDSYTLLGAYANYQVTHDLSIGLNLDNITDEKYFSSVKYDQAWYAAPRSYNLSASWQF